MESCRRRFTDYTIVEAPNIGELRVKVCLMLREGWDIFGALHEGELNYYREMVKHVSRPVKAVKQVVGSSVDESNSDSRDHEAR